MGSRSSRFLTSSLWHQLASIGILAFAVATVASSGAASDHRARKASTPNQVKQPPQTELDELPPTPEDIEERKQREALAILVNQMRAKARAEVGAAVQSVRTPDLSVLAKALGAQVNAREPEDGEEAVSTMEELGDLDGDGIPEAVFRWSVRQRFRIHRKDEEPSLPAWDLFLLSWDGREWRTSELMVGEGINELRVLKQLGTAPAVAVVETINLAPYPAIFRYRDHGASLLWDSKNDESRYQGYPGGEIEFREPTASAPPAMIVAGRADPGVLHFPRAARRGFDAATLYVWDGNAYVPRKTEFAENEDYTLYRFVSALHLHAFASAYALIDPAQFVKSQEKTIEAFRKQVEEMWPEFLADNIFEAGDPPEGAKNGFIIELDRGDIHYRYFPTFSHDGKFLLTGLERREEK